MIFSYYSDHTYVSLFYSEVTLKVAKSKPSLSGTLTSLQLLLGFQIHKNVD